MPYTKEEWKEVLGYDHLYEISNMGRVRTRYVKGKGYMKDYIFLEPLDNGNGYLRFNWKINGRQRTVYLHKLVAELFVDNPRHLTEINHLDENKYNNCANNLCWCTHKENCQYGTRNIRTAEKNARPVVCIEKELIFSSGKEAAQYFDVGNTAISNCLNGRTETCCGYHWRYLNVS